MSGIFDQLPDITILDSLRTASQAGFEDALNKTPKSSADLLGNLPDKVGALLGAIPADPASLTEELTTFFSAVQGATSLDLAGAVETVANGLVQVRGDVAGSPLGELALATGEARGIKDILLAQVPAFTAEFLADVTTLRDSILASEQVQLFIDFVDAIEAFTANLPTDADQIAGFLAQSFIGVPSDLLTDSLAQVDPLLAQFTQLSETAANIDAPARIQGLAGQLNGAANLVATIDLDAESSYQAAIDQLTLAQGSLGALTGSLQSALDGLDSGLATVNLAQLPANLEAALGAIPTLNVVGLDDIKIGILSPLQALNELLPTLTPQDFTLRVQLALARFSATLEESSFAEWPSAILGFFETVKDFIAQINLGEIRTQIETVFTTINQRIADLGANFKQQLIDALRTVLSTIEDAFDALDFSGAVTLIDNVFGQLNAALDALSVGDLQNELSSAIGTLDSVVAGLVTQTNAIAGQLHELISSLGEIQFDAVTAAVIAEIDEVTATLKQIDPASLGTAQRVALTAAVGVLQAIDFQGTITDVLVERCHEVVALPRVPLETVAARLDTLFAMIVAFDPEQIVAPLSDLFQQITGPLNSLQPDALIRPIKEAVAGVEAIFDRLSPAQLAAPLDSLFTPLVAKLDALSPATLLAPVSAVFDEFEQALQKVDLTSLLDELITLLDDLFAQARASILDHIQGLDLPDLVANFLSALAPLIELLSPALLVDPVNKFMEIIDSVISDFNPGQLLAPLQTLYDRVIALLNQVADDVLVAGLEKVRQTLVTALNRVDPAALSGQLNGLVQELTGFYAVLNPAQLQTALNLPYQDVRTAFAALDRSNVPPALQGSFDQIESLVNALNPAPALDSLQSSYQTGQERLATLGTVALDHLVDLFAPIRAQISALIPDFLTRPVTAEGLTAALSELSPAAIMAEISTTFDSLKSHFAALRPALVAEFERFRNEQQGVLVFLDFHALAARFQEIYAAIVAQISAVNPAIIIAEVQTVFATIRTTINDLNPTFLVDELTATFDQLKAKLDFGALDTLETSLESALQNVLAKVAQLDPVELLRAAGVLDAFGDLQTALASISVASVVTDLEEALDAVCDELGSELEKTKAAFEQMIDAVPSLDAGAGIGI